MAMAMGKTNREVDLTVVLEGQLEDVAGIGHGGSVRGKRFTMAIGAFYYRVIKNFPTSAAARATSLG